MPEVLAPARRVGAVERAAALLGEQPPTGEDGFLDPIDEVLESLTAAAAAAPRTTTPAPDTGAPRR